MGTITQRPRRDGSTAYRAEIVITVDGRRQTFKQTFDRKQAAKNWIRRKEVELRKPGGINKARAKKNTLGSVIEKYVDDQIHIGRTKAQVLQTIREYPVASLPAQSVKSSDIVTFAKQLHDKGLQPQTINNYLSHLSAVFQIAEAAWDIPLNTSEMKKALVATKKLNINTKSRSRDRRPTIEEMDMIMEHFALRSASGKAAPMHVICAFALFSTRRQAEICGLQKRDLYLEEQRILVRDMKNPGQKIGNHIWCSLPKEACDLIVAHGKDPVIFPYSPKAVTAAFTRGCKLLGIEDLRFHDLRHEGISRLFEMGMTIPEVATYSGHKSWSSLQRYSHIRAKGDKWTQWRWLSKLTQ